MDVSLSFSLSPFKRSGEPAIALVDPAFAGWRSVDVAAVKMAPEFRQRFFQPGYAGLGCPAAVQVTHHAHSHSLVVNINNVFVATVNFKDLERRIGVVLLRRRAPLDRLNHQRQRPMRQRGQLNPSS